MVQEIIDAAEGDVEKVLCGGISEVSKGVYHRPLQSTFEVSLLLWQIENMDHYILLQIFRERTCFKCNLKIHSLEEISKSSFLCLLHWNL